MTVEEYLKKHNMKQRELSRLSGVSPNAISKLAKGEGRFGVQTANKLAKLGISIPKEMVLTPSEKGKMGGEKAKLLRESKELGAEIAATKQKVKLKRFQVVAMKKFGNTIVSKKFKADGIIDEFARLGMKVELKDFKDKTYYGWNTHYIVQLVD